MSLGLLKIFDTIILLVLASPNAKCHLPISQDGDVLLYTGLKTLINISEHGNFSTQGRFWLGDWSKAVLCVDLFLQHFSCLHSNTWKHSDPHCTLQSVIDSSSSEMFAPLPCCDWFLCWHYCSAAFCRFYDGNRKCQMEYFLLDVGNFELHLLWIFSQNSYCQTAFSVDRLLAHLLGLR